MVSRRRKSRARGFGHKMRGKKRGGIIFPFKRKKSKCEIKQKRVCYEPRTIFFAWNYNFLVLKARRKLYFLKKSLLYQLWHNVKTWVQYFFHIPFPIVDGSPNDQQPTTSQLTSLTAWAPQPSGLRSHYPKRVSDIHLKPHNSPYSWDSLLDMLSLTSKGCVTYTSLPCNDTLSSFIWLRTWTEQIFFHY